MDISFSIFFCFFILITPFGVYQQKFFIINIALITHTMEAAVHLCQSPKSDILYLLSIANTFKEWYNSLQMGDFDMSDKHKLHKSLSALTMLSQLGLSIALPIVLCAMAGVWLKDKFGIGNWIVIAAILIGVGSGFCSMIKFIKIIQKIIDEENE